MELPRSRAVKTVAQTLGLMVYPPQRVDSSLAGKLFERGTTRNFFHPLLNHSFRRAVMLGHISFLCKELGSQALMES